MTTVSLNIKFKEFESVVKDCKDFQKFKDELTEWVRINPRFNTDTAVNSLHAAIQATKLKNSEDSVVRHAANKLLDSLAHDVDQFNKSAKNFFLVLKSLNSRKNLQFGDEQIELSENYYMAQPESEIQLRKFGRDFFNNCLKDREAARGYYQEFVSGKHEIRIIFDPKDNPVAIFTVNSTSREVEEFDFAVVQENSEDQYAGWQFVLVPHGVICDALKQLDCHGDNHRELVRLGVVSRFFDGIPQVSPILLHDGREIYVYIYKNEVITLHQQDDFSKYRTVGTRFILDTGMTYPEWKTTTSSGISVGELLWLIQQNPKLYQAFSQQHAGEQ